MTSDAGDLVKRLEDKASALNAEARRANFKTHCDEPLYREAAASIAALSEGRANMDQWAANSFILFALIQGAECGRLLKDALDRADNAHTTAENFQRLNGEYLERYLASEAKLAALSEENARLRGVTQEERHEGRCDDCGGVNPVWYAPNALWNAVVGGAEADEAPGFICPVCFIKRAEQRGEMHVWKMAPETDEDQARSAKMFALSEENERLKAALGPFALHERKRAEAETEMTKFVDGVEDEWRLSLIADKRGDITIGDLRRAAAALDKIAGKEG